MNRYYYNLYRPKLSLVIATMLFLFIDERKNSKVRTASALILLSLFLTIAPPLSAHIVVKKQPLIPQQILTKMSKSAIKKKYPMGITVTQKGIPDTLMTKLRTLEKSGYSIKWDQADNEILKTYADSVIRKQGILPYFHKIFAAPGCSNYLYERFLEHCINHSLSKTNAITSLEELKNKPPAFYRTLLKSHRYWTFTGYESMRTVPRRILQWLDKNAKGIEAIVHKSFKKCDVILSSPQLTEISLLLTLQYLSYAVEGLYYKGQLSQVTYYRKLAVDSLKPN